MLLMSGENIMVLISILAKCIQVYQNHNRDPDAV